MLKAGAIILSIWSGINLLLAAAILISMIVFGQDAPILVMVFERPEIAQLDARAIASANALAILYNSCAAAVSGLALFVIWSNLIDGQPGAFWVLLVTIGLVEILAFVAFAPVGNARWPVNALLSLLYVVGSGLAGYSLFITR